MIALDASALLAWLFREPSWEVVDAHLAGAALSCVNLAEVLSRLRRDGLSSLPLKEALERHPVAVVPFRAEDAEIVASLEPLARHHGLSLGDRACLALALSNGCHALTADRNWARLPAGFQVVLIR
jgi:PIN domain nuclease of toxin-antitoxin system